MEPPPADSNGPDSVLDCVFDYEAVMAKGGGGLVPPPEPLSEAEPTPGSQALCPSSWDIPSLSKDEAQQAFIQYASRKCCYSTRPAEDGVISSMETFDTHRYRLETFTETRSIELSLKPYYGATMDTSGQTPPKPWDILVNTPPFFEDGKQIIEVPHTASVKDCPCCLTSGRVTCSVCSGAGMRLCIACFGLGYVGYNENRQTCLVCGGRGRTSCGTCFGLGWNQCDICSGQGQVIASINLSVNWLNNVEEHIVEQSSGLKMSKLNKVPGKELFTDLNRTVHPVTTFPDPAVVQTSERLLSEHQAKYQPSSRLLQQRQTIELLPISKVTYEWRKESHVFFVYGAELKVSAKDYPAACCGCCCCCSVM